MTTFDTVSGIIATAALPSGMLRQIIRVSKFWRQYAGHLAVEAIDDKVMREFIPWRRDYYSAFKKLPKNAKLHPTDKTIQWDMMLGKAIVKWAAEQQSGLVLHRARHMFIRQQTSVINAIRAHLAEFGIVAPVGRHGVEELLNVVTDPNDKRVPDIARACLSALGAQLRRMKEQILEFDRLIRAWHRSNEMSMRLEEAPGVGPVLATALVAAVADPKSFRSGRNFSAWIGMVPKQHSTGGKNRLGNISKQGDRYLRGLFVAGALSVIRYAKIHGTKHRPWLTALLARRPTKVAAIALANKIARMVWAMMARGERYKEPVALAR
jgi:transposase